MRCPLLNDLAFGFVELNGEGKIQRIGACDGDANQAAPWALSNGEINVALVGCAKT